jgi:hypothetical protein
MDSHDSPRLELEGSHHLPPYNILCITPRHLHPNGTFSRNSQREVPKLSQFELPGLWEFIIPCLDLQLGWSLKKTCSPPWELSNGVLHSTYTHQGQVDSWFLVIKSQIASLTFGLSFVHNLCCRAPNGSCEAIFDIYISRPFKWYKKHLKARCFDPCYWTLSFWESRRTPKSPFRECECHPHTPSNWGCDTQFREF